MTESLIPEPCNCKGDCADNYIEALKIIRKFYRNPFLKKLCDTALRGESVLTLIPPELDPTIGDAE
jgi:hypothetical protein